MSLDLTDRHSILNVDNVIHTIIVEMVVQCNL